MGHLTDDAFEIFPATAEGILRWIETTAPRPSREEVVSHVGWLVGQGRISDADRRRLAEEGVLG